MSRLRSVSTAFWSDPLVEELNPHEKLLFLYLITNEKTNMLGIYENSVKKTAFETGLTTAQVEAIYKRFEELGRVRRLNGWLMVLNFAKHQNYNTNMKKSAIDCYLALPEELQNPDLQIDRDNPAEGFERILNHLGMVRNPSVTVRKVEVEYEVEVEREDETEKEAAKAVDLEFEEIWKTYRRKTGKQDALAKWRKLKPKERDMVRAHVPRYMEQKKDSEVQFIKEFSTYLNKKAWMDEISEEQEVVDIGAKWKAKLAELKSRQTVIEVTTDPTVPTYKILEYHNGKGMAYIAGVERVLENWLQGHWELIPLVKEVAL
jgi:hypothetical protein